MPAVEIRVIHLPRATARRAVMDGQFARLGLSAEGWDAVDAADPANAPRLAAMPDVGPIGPYVPHDKGCWLVHLDALRAFLQGARSHLLVLEDDVFLADDLPLWLSDLSWWPAGAEVVKIERCRGESTVVVLDRRAASHLGRSLPRMRSRHAGAAAYLVTRAGARRILQGAPQDLPADHALFNPQVSPLARALVVHQVVPALAVQGNDPPGGPATRPAKVAKTLGHRLTRARAELRTLTALPRLLSGRAQLVRIPWESRVAPDLPPHS